MLTASFLDAAHGDACLIRWPDNDGRQRTMLVDGGPATIYKNRILPHLTRHRVDVLDMVCVTHVDDDHIAGVIRLLKDIDRARSANDLPRFQVNGLWFNDVAELVNSVEPGLALSDPAAAAGDPVLAASYRQGRELGTLAVRLGLLGNAPFNSLIRQGTHGLVHDLHVTAVTPNQIALDRLAERWRRALLQPSAEVVAAAKQDHSVSNLSSITLHLRHGERTALLTGDARGDHIIAGLAAGGLLDSDRPLHIDVLKLPHHGSPKNVTCEFFQHLTADHYVISTDGHRHDHPDTETLNMLVESRSAADEYTIYLTNPVVRALDTLEDLQRGRAFRVEVRADADFGVTIAL